MYFSELMAEGEEVQLLYHGPFTISAACSDTEVRNISTRCCPVLHRLLPVDYAVAKKLSRLRTAVPTTIFIIVCGD